MEYPFKKKIFSEEETARLAVLFAEELKPGDVVVLNGNLGAGKTFFIKNVVRALGGDNVNSPTFAIVNEYNGNYKIYHFDFYRINEIVELYDIGFNDYLNDSESIIFIEWGNLLPEALPKKRIDIDITMEEDFLGIHPDSVGTREFNFIKHD